MANPISKPNSGLIIEISNRLIIKAPSQPIRDEIKNTLTIQNPAWLENERMGRWNGNTPRFLHYCAETSSGLIAPRGFLPQLIGMAKCNGEHFEIEDRRRVLPAVDFRFHGQLRPFQEKAAHVMLSRDMGVLAAPTGSGKTVIALCMIAQRKQPTLVIVHSKQILTQWISRIEQFLGIPPGDVGKIGDGEHRMGDCIKVALVQTLYKCSSQVSPHIGYLIVDECHRTPSRTFTVGVSAFDAKFITGLSATPWRRDKMSRLIFWYVGNVLHKIEKDSIVGTGDVLPAEVVTRETDFQPYSDPTTQYAQMLSELTRDPARNHLIAADVVNEARKGSGICLILSDRKSHCSTLQDLLREKGVESELLTGDLSDGEREQVVDDLNRGRIRVLIATGQLIGEGFDCKELSTLFLTTPISFDGRLLQYLGRVLRPAPGKTKATVYDYVDRFVGPLKAAGAARRRVYSDEKTV